jgi:uncharacterized membrane protein
VGRNKGKGIGIQIPHQQIPHQTTERELLIQASSSSFSGPIPPPELLERYNDVIPNGAERIMVMAERQSAHREALEARVINGNVANQTRGSIFGFILSLVAIVGGFVLIEQERMPKDWHLSLRALLPSLGFSSIQSTSKSGNE